MIPKFPPWRNRIQFVPLPDRPAGGADEDARTKAIADVDAPGVGPHELLVAPHQFVVLGQDDVVAGDAVADHEVDPQDGEEDGAEDAEEPELDQQQRGEDVVVVDGVEPEAVGVDPRQRAQ